MTLLPCTVDKNNSVKQRSFVSIWQLFCLLVKVLTNHFEGDSILRHQQIVWLKNLQLLYYLHKNRFILFLLVLVYLYSSLWASSPFGGYHEKLACFALGLVALPLVCVILALLAFLAIWNGELGCTGWVYITKCNDIASCMSVHCIIIECVIHKTL